MKLLNSLRVSRRRGARESELRDSSGGEDFKLQPGSLWFRLASRLFHDLLINPGTMLLWKWNGGRLSGALPPGSFVLVANHSGHFDWMLLDVLLARYFRRRLRFLANLKVYGNPFWKMLIHEREAILVDYSVPSKAAVAMLRFIRRGGDDDRIVGVFPEGTRTRTGQMNPPSRGAAWAARKGGVAIVPVAVCGAWELWPPQHRLPTLKRVGLSVHVLEPLYARDFASDEEMTQAAMTAIYERVYTERARRRT